MQSTRTTRRRAVLALAALATAAAVLVAPPRADAAGLLVADGGLGGALEIEEHDVDVTINNGIAVTSVTQVFRNTEDRQLEALYTFPVPKGASVSEFSMWIGGKEMVGEVVEKRRAREIYDSYKRRNVDPGLLEQVDHKTFEMRIFPVAPRAEQRVRIVYHQELDVDRDWATYVYPLATKAVPAESRTRGKFALRLTARSEIPVVQMESPSHGDDFVVVKDSPHQVQASLEATGGDLQKDFVLAYRLERPRTGLDVVASKEPGADGTVLLTLTAGDELGDERSGMDYVFVLDVSGSMEHDGKLGLSRGSVEAFVQALGDDDRFDVVTFNVAATSAFQSLRAADGGARQEATAFLAGQRARGGTVLGPALRTAYAYKDPDRTLNVVVLSDGMTEQSERGELMKLIRERPQGARVFAIGIGNEVDRPLLTRLAEDAGGLAEFVSRGDDFDRKAAAFRRKLMRPAIGDLEIVSKGGKLFDAEPRKLPNLYHGVPVRMYARYAKAGNVNLTVRGTLEGAPFERSFDVALPAAAADNPEIERMWAWRRAERLEREGGEHPDQATKEEIVRLGEGWSIVTPYTSFLVLENDGEYQRWKIERRNVTRVERDRAARERLRDEIAALRVMPAQPAPRTADAARASDSPTANSPAPAGAPSAPVAREPSRGVDLDVGDDGPSRKGGGALDPLSVALVLALGGAAAAARRRRDRDAA